MPSTIIAIGTALPEHRLEPADAIRALTPYWPQLERLESIDASLGTRYLCEPVDQLLAARSLSNLNVAYRHHATRLALAAARTALHEAGLSGADIDLVVTVSCTGYLVPSLDVHIAGELGLRPDVLRLPITELGCSAGSAAVAIAHRHLMAFPSHRVLVIAVELPSLNFQPADLSIDNLTACLVFGDGAAAAVMCDSSHAPRGLQVVKAASHLIPNSAEFLGFDLRDGGFHIVLNRRLARIIERELPAVVEGFASDGPTPAFHAVHAAGPRIMDTVASALHLPEAALAPSRRAFADVGNTSSAAIFFTFQRLLEALGPAFATGLGIGLGPGVSVELMELRWQPVGLPRAGATPSSEPAEISDQRTSRGVNIFARR